jgi:hypothetical protein
MELENWFLALDGDDIGRRLEFYMVSEDADGLRIFSKSFARTIEFLSKSISESVESDILLHGGDSILLSLDPDRIERVIELVRQATRGAGFTFSGGYGPTMREAYLALKIAKASGKDMIIPLSFAVDSA